MWFTPNKHRFFLLIATCIFVGNFGCSNEESSSSKSNAKPMDVAQPAQKEVQVKILVKDDKEQVQEMSQAPIPGPVATDLLVGDPGLGFGGPFIDGPGLPGFGPYLDVPLDPFFGPPIPLWVTTPLRAINLRRNDDDDRHRHRDDDDHRRDDTGKNDDDCIILDDNNCPVDDDGAPIN